MRMIIKMFGIRTKMKSTNVTQPNVYTPYNNIVIGKWLPCRCEQIDDTEPGL